ncbi:hypothetical protein OG792_24320 [Micromonospora sp. NBC_01699]|uniref:hypothetical protein n=1 Tax=Micromonospora sp. NBC_01699 TaxID=2975984 RepID=UPI002E2C7117|nr:hypothetical protein [Micromonospora sp. NBC_01699]
MVYVQLVQGWTDEAGVNHPAGEMVDVDAATLARLQAEGIVGEAGGGAGGGGVGTDWVGPTSTKP